MSAVASVTIAGMLVTGMPRRVASARSMRSCVMFIDDTARSFGLAASTSLSTMSCSSDNRMSQRFTPSISAALPRMRLELRIDLDVRDGAQPRQRALGDRLGDEDAGPACQVGLARAPR